MKSGVTLAFALVAVLLLGTVGSAHHPISAKFDDTKPQTLTGIVTLVDWRNPHVHVFMNVRNDNDADNWAIELESPIDLQASGWTRDSVKPGDAITVAGITARNGSRQVWANSITMTGTGQEVLHVTPATPPALLANRPDAALARQAAEARTERRWRAGLLGVPDLHGARREQRRRSRWTSGDC